jgi:HlyD family secretion protein
MNVKSLTRRLPLVLASIAALALLAYALWPRPVGVDVAAVVRGPLQVTVDEDGKTRVQERFIVAAPLTGQLARIDLDAGDAVEAGKTLLATIAPVDPSLLDERTRSEAEARVRAAEAARDQAAARVKEADEAHEVARHEFDRVKALRKTKAVPEAEYDRTEHEEQRTAHAIRSAEFAEQVAQFELEVAKAALQRTRPSDSANQIHEQLELRSPITGRVLRVIQESATVVAPGMPLLELGDPSQMEVEVDVLSADAALIRPGARVRLEQWGGEKPLEARVRLVEPSGFTKISALGVEEQRVNVIADFVGAVEQRSPLGDAFRVEARIVVWESDNVLKVPAGSLFRHGSSWAVYLLIGNVVQLREVNVGHNNGLEAEVLEGLNEGDRVVLHPSDKLRDRAYVTSRKTKD